MVSKSFCGSESLDARYGSVKAVVSKFAHWRPTNFLLCWKSNGTSSINTRNKEELVESRLVDDGGGNWKNDRRVLSDFRPDFSLGGTQRQRWLKALCPPRQENVTPFLFGPPFPALLKPPLSFSSKFKINTGLLTLNWSIWRS